jgi:hypothetical protein
MKPLTVIVTSVLLLCAAPMAHGQSSRTHVGGRGLTGTLLINTAKRVSIETTTLTFGNAGAPTFTVDFTAMIGLDPSTPPPTVVDITVTQYPPDDENPEMTLRIDGQPIPLITRLHSRRSIVSTIPFSEFLQITAAAAIMEDAFQSELEFSPAQLGMLRATADRWARR